MLIIRRCHRARKTELASYQEISTFLAEVQRRAFKQAMFAVKDEDAALDVVQDAMLKLTEKYSAKPSAELPHGGGSIAALTADLLRLLKSA